MVSSVNKIVSKDKPGTIELACIANVAYLSVQLFSSFSRRNGRGPPDGYESDPRYTDLQALDVLGMGLEFRLFLLALEAAAYTERSESEALRSS